MRNLIIASLSAFALFASPALVSATETGAAAGAATGAAAGAAVGGPVGAAVGAGVGGATGHAATGPDRTRVETTGTTGCRTKTTQKTNDLGDTKTKRKTTC